MDLSVVVTVPQGSPRTVRRQRALENEHRTQLDSGLGPVPQAFQLVDVRESHDLLNQNPLL